MSLITQEGGEQNPPKPRKPTIVVVDDCELTLASTAEALERAGYRVITRDRPAGCVAMMLQEKPDLVLLDVCMPTVSGDTLVKLFSKASPNSGTIILLSPRRIAARAAAERMAELQVRRLPVLSREKRLVGIIALGDIAQSDHDERSPTGVAITGVSEGHAQA